MSLNVRMMYLPAMSLIATIALKPTMAQEQPRTEIASAFFETKPDTEGVSAVRLQADGGGASSLKRDRQLYLHLFRSPSTGLEYRQGNIGIHAGLYTTILGRGGKSTEFFKTGVTGYYKFSRNPRYEGFFSVAYMRGINRDYKNRDGLFIESGVRWLLGKQLELRTGLGILASDGRGTHVNPTIGLSWNISL